MVRPEAHHIETSARPRRAQQSASLLRYSPALVLIAIAIADLQRWADPDLWGHVAFGRAMLATHRLAFHDPYSYSAPGHLWLNHEWLSEALMGAFYDLGGVIGLKLMKFGCCAALIVLLARGLAEIDSLMTLQFGLLIAAAIAIAPQMQFRPQLFSFAMIAGLLAILTKYTYRGEAPLFALIPMLWLWANLHGGFLIGLAALATFSAVRITTDLLGGRGPWVGARLFVILAASIAVTFVTPFGLGTWYAVGHALTNSHTRQVIEDWQPLMRSLIAMWHQNHVGAIPDLFAIAIFMALGVTLVLNPRRGDSAIVAVALLLIGAALLATRNVPLAVIASVVPLAEHSSSFFHATQTHRASRGGQILIAVIAVILLIGSGLLSPTLRAGSSKPVGAIAFMRERRLRGNVMSDFAWGEYLIWHLAPASKVFIDGRYDTVYPPNVIDDYLTFQYGELGGKEILRKYPHDFILLSPNDESALALVGAAPQWKRIYRDGTCILFARADSEAAKMPAVDNSAHNTPPSYFP
jgi:hypothetical protein